MNMNTKHVTSLEISKKLQELGVKQASEFYWDSHARDKIESGYGITSDGEYSAFLASELGELLPKRIKLNMCDWASWEQGEYEMTLTITHSRFVLGDMGGWYVDYEAFGGATLTGLMSRHSGVSVEFRNKNEADARGIMLIYLIENNLLKAGAQ